MSTTTTNMSLVKPGVSTEPGPDWASQLNTNADTLDVHDHSTGKGVQITPAGLNINSDLEFNDKDAEEVRSVGFQSQASTISTSETLRCYSSGGELYYNDNAGNAVKITNAGAVNVSGSNGIGGDYGGGNPAALNFTEATNTYEMFENTSGPSYADVQLSTLKNRGGMQWWSTSVSSSPHAVATTDLVLLVDTSSARTITLPAATAARRVLIIKDSTGSGGTNAITLDRAAGGNIDGVAANKTLKKNYGVWTIISDASNWFVIKEDVQDQTSVTVFDGSTTAGTDAIPTAYASPTLSAAALTEGTAVSRSTNDLTFPFTGKYRVDFFAPLVNKSTGGGSGFMNVRLRNTTDSTTSGVGVPLAGITTSSTQSYSTSFFVNITDIAKVYQLQWAASDANTQTTTTAVVSETGPRWRIVISKLKGYA